MNELAGGHGVPPLHGGTMDRTYKYFDIIMALFVSVLLISNIASVLARCQNTGI